jgi:hypothetical protein
MVKDYKLEEMRSMMKKRLFLFLLEGLLVVIFLSVSEMIVYAEEIIMGPLRVKPSIRIQERYEDNIFLEPTDKKSDYITTIAPSIGLELPFGAYRASLAYTLNDVNFSNYPSQNSYNHEVTAFLGRNFTNFKFTAEDDFQDTRDLVDPELTTRIRRLRNDVGANVSTDLHRVNLDVGFRNILDDYKESAWQQDDRYENIFAITGKYRVLPKTSLLLEYNLGEIRYRYYTSDHPNANYNQGFVGIEGNLTSRCLGVIKVGYQERNYNRSGVPNFYGLVATVSVTEKFTARDIGKLAFLRSAVESIYSINNYYEANRLVAEYGHDFTKRFSGRLTTAYQFNTYPYETTEEGETRRRKDTLWTAGILLNYKLRKWLSFEAGYLYDCRNSNFGVFDYGDNISTISVTAEF